MWTPQVSELLRTLCYLVSPHLTFNDLWNFQVFPLAYLWGGHLFLPWFCQGELILPLIGFPCDLSSLIDTQKLFFVNWLILIVRVRMILYLKWNHYISFKILKWYFLILHWKAYKTGWIFFLSFFGSGLDFSDSVSCLSRIDTEWKWYPSFS